MNIQSGRHFNISNYKNLGVGSHVLTSSPRSAASVHIVHNTLQKLEVIAGRTYLLKYGSKSTIFLEYKILHNFFSDFGLLYFMT